MQQVNYSNRNDLLGRKFAAEIVSTQPGLVRLCNREGKEIDFPTPQFTATDQTVVRDWEQAKLKAEEASSFTKEFMEARGNAPGT